MNIWKHYNEDVCVITPNDSVAWIQFSTCTAWKATHVFASSCVLKNFGFTQFPLITPGTQGLTHPAGRQENAYINSQAAACDSWMARCSPMCEGLAEAISIIKLHAPISFEHEFHDNKRVVNNTLRGIEHGSLDWEPTVVTMIPLVYVSFLILLCTDIQLRVLKWPLDTFHLPEAVQDIFFSSPTTITWSRKYPE